ncbi:MAG: amidohydrolase family protein [Bacteroidota bacterium]
MKLLLRSTSFLSLAFCLLLGIPVKQIVAQGSGKLKPVNRTYALTNVNIMQAPGKSLGIGTVVIKDGLIVDVGSDVAIPADAQQVKVDSMYIYAGFIEGASHTAVPKPKADRNRPRVEVPGNPPNDLAGIMPERSVKELIKADDKSISAMRALGFTASHTLPHGNPLPGQGAIILLDGESADEMIFMEHASLFSTLQGNRGVYPGTVIGVMAKFRDLYRNAELSKSHADKYASNPLGKARPNNDRVLSAFYPSIDKDQSIFFHTQNLSSAYRAFRLQKDLGFNLTLVELKEGWELIDKIKGTGTKVFLSSDLPKKPEDKKKEKEEGVEMTMAEKEVEALEARKAEWYKKYASQAAKFEEAGISFGLSNLEVSGKNLKSNLRTMIEHGLSEEAALAALTTGPAKLLGLSSVMGTVEKGKMANLVISDMPYFEEKSQVRYVFVDGNMYEYEAKAKKKKKAKEGGEPSGETNIAAALGVWSFEAETPGQSGTGTITFTEENGNILGTLESDQGPGEVQDLSNVVLDGNDLSFSMSIDGGGQSITIEISIVLDGESFEGDMEVGSFGSFPIKGERTSKPE